MITDSRDGTSSVRYVCWLRTTYGRYNGSSTTNTHDYSPTASTQRRACSMQMIMKRRAKVDLPDAASPITSTGRP